MSAIIEISVSTSAEPRYSLDNLQTPHEMTNLIIIAIYAYNLVN